MFFVGGPRRALKKTRELCGLAINSYKKLKTGHLTGSSKGMQCSKVVCERGAMTVYHERLGVSFLSKMPYNKHRFGPRDRVSKYYTADKCCNPFYVDSAGPGICQPPGPFPSF